MFRALICTIILSSMPFSNTPKKFLEKSNRQKKLQLPLSNFSSCRILVFWPTRWMITISCFELQQQNSISNLKQDIFFLKLKKRRSITRLEIWWNHHKLYLVTVKSYLFNKSRRRKIWCISRKFASIQIREGKQGKTWDRPWRNLKG